MYMKNIVYFLVYFSFNVLSSQVVGTPYMPLVIPRGSITFNYTGAEQTWTVPSSPSGSVVLNIDAYGAQGGGSGGNGGRVQTTLTLSSGTVLRIVVGGQPNSRNPIYGFAGSGGANFSTSGRDGFAGGGLTGIFNNISISQANCFMLAAGGGGASGLNLNSGGIAGAPNGSNGNQGNFSGFQEGGRGATQSAAGAAGTSIDAQSSASTSGSAINGGNGGSINTTTWVGGGGGGAGFFGGGGGAGGGSSNGAGGGGSSFVNTSFTTNTTYTAGVRTGNGVLTIVY
jgi:hypothetical protein